MGEWSVRRGILADSGFPATDADLQAIQKCVLPLNHTFDTVELISDPGALPSLWCEFQYWSYPSA